MVCLFCSAKLIKFQLWLTTASLVDWICTPLKHRKVSALFFNNTIFFSPPFTFALEPPVTTAKFVQPPRNKKLTTYCSPQRLDSDLKKRQICYKQVDQSSKRSVFVEGCLISKGKSITLFRKKKKICQLNSRVPFHTSNFAIYVFFLRTHKKKECLKKSNT